jgi:putative ABC transport system ATP-binding protein
MQDYVIESSRLTKEYSSKSGRPIVVLKDVDMQIESGTMVAIVGPSGAGKSTLLYCLAGLEKATSGSVSLAGRLLTKQSPSAVSRLHRGLVGFIFQTLNLVPSLTALDNVTLPARFARQKIDKKTAYSCLQALGVEERSQQPTAKLSLGEQQRVAVARILYNNPKIVFADEPTGALDTTSGRVVLHHLRLATDRGQTIVMVTHDLEAASVADVVYVMRDGVIAARLNKPTVEQVFDAMRPRQELGQSL